MYEITEYFEELEKWKNDYRLFIEENRALGVDDETILREFLSKHESSGPKTFDLEGFVFSYAEVFGIPDEVLIKILDRSPESHLSLKYNPDTPTDSDFVPLRRKSDEALIIDRPESHLGLKYNPPNTSTDSNHVPLRRKSDEGREL